MGLADVQQPDADAQLIVLRVVIRSPDVDTFITKYSRFIRDDRIFIFTKASQPPGTRVRFTLELADGPQLLTGEGTVTRVRGESDDPSKPPGMELRFQPVDEPSREMIARMMAARLPPPPPARLPPPPAQPLQPLPPVPPLPAVGSDALTGARPSLPLGDDASTKIRGAGMQPLPVHTPVGGMPIVPMRPGETREVTVPGASPSPSGGDHAEHTDVDRNSARKRILPTPTPFVATPTPLPAPLPLPTLMTPAHGIQSPLLGESGGSGARRVPSGFTRPSLPALSATPAMGLNAAGEPEPLGGAPESSDEAAFAVPSGEAPRFAESYVGKLPPPPGAPPAAPGPSETGTGMVPANPFGEVSDYAIEYFVEWSMEQSTADPRRTASATAFENVPMKPPARERGPGALRLYGGMMLGLLVGVPLGGVAVWAALRPSAPAALPPERPAAGLAKARPAAPPPEAPVEPAPPTRAAVEPEKAEKVEKAEKPEPEKAAKAEKPAPEKPEAEPSELPPPPALATHKGKTATLRIKSTPPGADVVVKGEPQGQTPVDVELPPNHRYEITVTQAGKPPWHRRVNLKPPLTEVTASFH